MWGVVAPIIVVLLCSTTALTSFNRLLSVYARMRKEMGEIFSDAQQTSVPKLYISIDGKRSELPLPHGYYCTRMIVGITHYALC